METFELIVGFIREWYVVPIVFVYVGVLITILIENRNPTKTVSWILVIVFLPVFGLLLYYLFGQSTKKLRKIKKAQKDQYKRIQEELAKYDEHVDTQISSIYDDIGGLSHVFQYLKNEKISIPTLNNKVKFILNGEEKFALLLEAIESAKDFIHLEYYIFEADGIGRKVLDLLEKKHQEGVKIRLILDGFGSPRLIRFLSKNKKLYTFEWQAFLPVTFASLADSNYRDHRKIAIVDGKVAFVGGINIANKYINTPTRRYWRDTAVRLEGDAVGLLQIHFWDIWNQTDGIPFSLKKDKIKRMYNAPDKISNNVVSFAACDPASKAPHSMESILISLGQATQKVQLSTPYYIPNEELETALMATAARGVEVELIIPKEGDSKIVQHASFSFLKPLLRRGVKVYLYEKGMMHAKTINIDNKLSFVGTVNLDVRSFYINYEIMAVILDHAFTKEMSAQFEIDKSDSLLFTLDDYLQRSNWKRGIDSLCRLLAPVL